MPDPLHENRDILRVLWGTHRAPTTIHAEGKTVYVWREAQPPSAIVIATRITPSPTIESPKSQGERPM